MKVNSEEIKSVKEEVETEKVEKTEAISIEEDCEGFEESEEKE